MKTRFLIFISSAVRQYDFPRIEGFKHTTEFRDIVFGGKPLGERYVYLGRELTIEEFNTASAKIFSPDFAGEDRTFQPLAIDGASVVKKPAPVVVDATPEPVAEEVAPAEEATADAEAPAETTPKFRLEGKDIFDGEERVGGLFDPGNHLRVAHGKKDLRPEIEAFLATQTITDS